MPYPNATKFCGAAGLASPSLAELLLIDKQFRVVYQRVKKLWTGWKRYNRTHFFDEKNKFQVHSNDSCQSRYLEKSKPFAFDFVNTVRIEMHEGKYVAVSKTYLFSLIL